MISPGFFRLPVKRPQALIKFTQDICYAHQILVGLLDFLQCLFLTQPVFDNPRRFFQYHPAVVGTNTQDCINLPLADEGVPFFT